MIIEPAGWELQCDTCQTEYEFDEQPEDHDDVVDVVLSAGWIMFPFDHYCSLDCLLTARQKRHERDSHAEQTRWHIEDHARRCCRRHGTHATRGYHGGYSQCPDRSLRGTRVGVEA